MTASPPLLIQFSTRLPLIVTRPRPIGVGFRNPPFDFGIPLDNSRCNEYYSSMSGKLAAEIKQTKPFSSPAEEAILNIQRTASVLAQALGEFLKPHGISETQYNALR